jgi:hypothetical protein
MRKLLFAAALAASALMAVGVSTAGAANTTVKVTSKDTGNNWYSADTRNAGTGIFETGPATPPLGNGSFELSTPGPADKVQLFTDLYNGTALSAIQGIGYSTYRDLAPVSSPALVALNLRIDTNGDNQPDAYMVYEPYQDEGNGAVQDNVWQNWDAYKGGTAKWWLNTGAGGCGQATPCSWSAIVTAFPTATIREGINCGPAGIKAPCPGSLGLNQGSGNPGVRSNGDALYVSIGGNTTTYNFDAPVGPPISKDDCKNGGWATFDTPRTFKNQGDCVSYVQNGK